MKLGECASKRVVAIDAQASIDDAIALLEKHRVRHLPVVRNGRPVGMVSEGDVLGSVGGFLSEERVSTADASVRFAGPTSVDQIMSTDVVALSPQDDTAEAVRKMLERGVSAVILVEADQVAGIVTETDFLKAFFEESSLVPPSCRERRVADHMSDEVVSASPEDNAFALIRRMAKRFHHLPVVDSSGVIGIVSDHDVRRAFAMDKIEKITDPHEHVRLMEHYDVRRIMSDFVETITPDATLADAAKRMVDARIGSLPVIESEELIGMITETDILKACVAFSGE